MKNNWWLIPFGLVMFSIGCQLGGSWKGGVVALIGCFIVSWPIWYSEKS